MSTPVWALGEAGDRICLAPEGFRSGVVCYVEMRQAQDAGARLRRPVAAATLGGLLAEAERADLALYVVGGTRVLMLDRDKRAALDLGGCSSTS